MASGRWRHLEFDWEWGNDYEDAGMNMRFNGEVKITENPVVHVIYGPRGEVVSYMQERDEVPFGFQASAKAEV